jgi:myo-inositol 2-dehydrogenase/D-chiro-inositol 1-dehydrogenase
VTLSLGIIGAGNMGALRAGIFDQMEGIEIVGVAGGKTERTRQLAARLGVPAWQDPMRFLADTTMDAVAIATPSATHADLACAALARGKHVFCEPPLASNATEARRMVDAAKVSDRLLLAGMLSRMTASGRKIRELVTRRWLGVPRFFETERLSAPPARERWGPAVEHYGDAIEELLLFDLDLITWILGPPREVLAVGIPGNDGRALMTKAVLNYEDAMASATASFLLPASWPYTATARVTGSRGAVSSRTELHRGTPPKQVFVAYPEEGAAETVELLPVDPYRAECRHFLERIHGRAERDLLTGESALLPLTVMDAVRDCLVRGESVEL